MEKKSLDFIIKRLKEIKNRGFISSRRGYDTGIGHTLEQLLGLKENNLSIPDWGTFEVKGQRIETGSYITILTKKPDKIKNAKILERYGYPRPKNGKMVIHQTVFLNKLNRQGFVLKDNIKKRTIDLYKKNTLLGSYKKSDLRSKFLEKIGDGIILVFAESKKYKGIEKFRYAEAYLLKDFVFKRYLNNIYYDIRIGRYPDGRPHDHGSAFRVKKSDLKKIFKTYRKIL